MISLALYEVQMVLVLIIGSRLFAYHSFETVLRPEVGGLRCLFIAFDCMRFVFFGLLTQLIPNTHIKQAHISEHEYK